jgi:hypothetical protein
MLKSLNSARSGRQFLRRSDAAAYVTEEYGFPCSRQWLAKLAVIGGGPVFRKAGRYPVYEPSELDRWAEARIGPPQSSTSEVGRDPLRRRALARPSTPSGSQRDRP